MTLANKNLMRTLAAFAPIALVMFSAKNTHAADIDKFYTDLNDKPNPTWSDLIKSIPVGRNSLGPAFGSKIKVNHEAVNQGTSYSYNNPNRPIVENIAMHTATHSHIGSKNFHNITRWYQEDGNTQVFRMFPGDDNIRNARSHAPRTEAYSLVSWKRGDGWYEWSGRYTFLKVRPGAVFQLKHNSTYWSIHLAIMENEEKEGVFDLYYIKLRDPDAKTLLLEDIVGKGADIRILDDGDNHHIYVNQQLIVKNSMTDRGDDEHNRARWGLYSPQSAMDRDILIFVSGVYVGPAAHVFYPLPAIVPRVDTTPPSADDERAATSPRLGNPNSTSPPSTNPPSAEPPSTETKGGLDPPSSVNPSSAATKGGLDASVGMLLTAATVLTAYAGSQSL